MTPQINKPKSFFDRIPLILILLALFAFSPVLIGFTGTWITEMQTGEPCHEADCYWGAFGWYTFITLPIAGVQFIVLIILINRNAGKKPKDDS